MSIKSLSKVLEDYRVGSIEENYNGDEEEIVVHFYKPVPVTRINLEHWF